MNEPSEVLCDLRQGVDDRVRLQLSLETRCTPENPVQLHVDAGGKVFDQPLSLTDKQSRKGRFGFLYTDLWTVPFTLPSKGAAIDADVTVTCKRSPDEKLWASAECRVRGEP